MTVDVVGAGVVDSLLNAAIDDDGGVAVDAVGAADVVGSVLIDGDGPDDAADSGGDIGVCNDIGLVTVGAGTAGVGTTLDEAGGVAGCDVGVGEAGVVSASFGAVIDDVGAGDTAG
ncbi:MAG: hypothetical protein JWO97_4653 [Acidobacteria bacterium]|nr:hypothetical protein [Acidobacteriota bacterium]